MWEVELDGRTEISTYVIVDFFLGAMKWNLLKDVPRHRILFLFLRREAMSIPMPLRIDIN